MSKVDGSWYREKAKELGWAIMETRIAKVDCELPLALSRRERRQKRIRKNIEALTSRVKEIGFSMNQLSNTIAEELRNIKWPPTIYTFLNTSTGDDWIARWFEEETEPEVNPEGSPL